MFAAAISNVREFLGSWKNLLALGTLPLLGGWIFSRVWMVNPAILGDEYLYSLNARKAGPWDPPLAGDFSNYLFNFVYQGTNLCGDAFYTCGKIFNLVFFLGFIFTLFLVALRFLPFWGAYGFMVLAALSPLSVYTSMFLPESMFFFFVGLILLATLRAISNFTWQNWALAGLSIGLASLVKPHAWLSAIAVGITLLVVGLTQRANPWRNTLFSGLALVAGAILGRFAVGLLVGGPKALSLFGVYVDNSTVEQVVSGPSDVGEGVPITATSPIDGVFALFSVQLNTHALALVALMGLAIIGTIVAVWDLLRSRELTPVNGFGLFAFIWLASLMIEIVMFTGWVTGGGDDHTTRILLRYYDFLFVIVPLAGLSVLASPAARNLNVFFRWAIAILFGALLTPAFSGFFATLTIQIADAPNLAGLVVNEQVFNAAATIGFLSILLFATFPRYSPWAFALLLPVTFVLTGWQIQDQYSMFRGSPSAADIAGKYMNSAFSESELAEFSIIAPSRFDATNAGIWMDVPDIYYEAVPEGVEVPVDFLPEDRRLVLLLGDYSLSGTPEVLLQGEGFAILDARD